MNSFFRKELRLLLPGGVLGALTLLSILWIPATPPRFSASAEVLKVLPILLVGMTALALGLQSFGTEISANTFSQLLSQPIARSRIWRTKLWLLVGSTSVLFLLYMAAVRMSPLANEGDSRHSWIQYCQISGLTLATLASGGLWTVLLFRQATVAIWVTLLSPLALLMMVLQAGESRSEESVFLTATIVLLAYSALGLAAARRLFMRAEDIAWTGGELAWDKKERSAPIPFKVRGPVATLFFKELRLQQSQFVIAGFLALLHLAVIALRHWRTPTPENPVLQAVLNDFWLLWFAIPFVVASASIAEERRCGTLEAQLTLPVRRRTEWLVKVGTTLLLALFFGVVMPLLLEGKLLKISTGSRLMTPGEVILTFALYNAGIAFLGLFASSLSSNSFQALGIAVLLYLASAIAYSIAGQLPLGFLSGPLFPFIYLPCLLVTLTGLMLWNHRQVRADGMLWKKNLKSVAGAFMVASLVAGPIHYRAWEWFTPFEPEPGPARLAMLPPGPLQYSDNHLLVHLPGNRWWVGEPQPAQTLQAMFGFPQYRWAGKFLPDSNWISVASVWSGLAAIHQDGTLWVAEPLFEPANTFPRGWEKLGEEKWIFRNRVKSGLSDNASDWKWVQLGMNHDWRKISQHQNSFLLLKTDGSLWRLGDHTRPFQALNPVPFGNERWDEMFPTAAGFFLRKTDGTWWQLFDWRGLPLSLSRTPYLEGKSWKGLARSMGDLIGIDGDGQLGIHAQLEAMDKHQVSEKRTFDLVKREVLLPGSDWVALASDNGQNTIALKSNGTLWHWKVTWRRDRRFSEPTRLGSRSDWIGIQKFGGATLSLAADGTLWAWPRFMDHPKDYDGLIPPSRRPTRVGGIFDPPAK